MNPFQFQTCPTVKSLNKEFRELEFVMKYHRRRSKKQLENRGLYQNCNKCMFDCNCKSAGGDGQVDFGTYLCSPVWRL